MSSSIEVLQIDRRYEDCRVRDPAREARLLANIAERGIQQPLAGVWTGSVFILLDGFKRLRAAERLQIYAVPRRSLGDEEALGIIRLMRSEKQTALNVFEEARFIERLVNVHQMSLGDIAAQLNRSKAWVSMRRGLLAEMPVAVRELLSQGKFPVYAYLHTLRPFMRVNGVSPAEIEQFVRLLAGQSVSLRDIQLLADSCFRGPAPLREAILQGNWRWSLQQIRETLSSAGACTAAEQQLLHDLSQACKLLSQLTSRSVNVKLATPAVLVEIDLLTTALLSQLPTFQQSQGAALRQPDQAVSTRRSGGRVSAARRGGQAAAVQSGRHAAAAIPTQEPPPSRGRGGESAPGHGAGSRGLSGLRAQGTRRAAPSVRPRPAAVERQVEC